MNKRQKRVLIVYSSITFFVIVGFIVRATKLADISLENNLWLVLSSFMFASIIWEGSRFLHQQLNKYLPFEKNVTLRIVVQLLIASILLITLRAIVLTIFKDIIPPFVKNDSIILKIVYFIDFILASAIHLAYISSYFFNQWKISLKRAELLEKEKTQVQFDNLKNQLNPHFLFNNLTLLDSLIHEQPELASKFLQHLSKIYRYVLQNQEKETVSLETENAFIDHYISLMETRFGDGLKITRAFTPTGLEKRIVPVTLQILIENAIKHNTTHHQKPLLIELSNDDEYLIIKNNIQLKAQVESSNKVGLVNLRSLYKYLSKKNIDIYSENNVFTVKIPLIEE